jgi:alkanesulfonate monooxygenase SsuD/methylene tetrahydromethanopterin reductase-like flavin-dependent oxidoreductase (luciferase family)
MAYLTAEEMGGRVAVVDAELRKLSRDAVQRNIIVLHTEVTDNRLAALEDYSRFLKGTLSAGQVGEAPAILIGSPEEIAQQVLMRHKNFGFTYFTVQEAALDEFAQVIALLS